MQPAAAGGLSLLFGVEPSSSRWGAPESLTSAGDDPPASVDATRALAPADHHAWAPEEYVWDPCAMVRARARMCNAARAAWNASVPGH